MKIAVLTSGGVDSSVALNLLQKEGHDLTAFYLKIWLEDELSYLGECPWEEDLSYVRKICKQAKIPLDVINMQKEYWDRVVAYTIQEAKAGRTPNPDILCNQQIKFGEFYKKISKSFEKVATGHYANVQKVGRRFVLKKSPDLIKDQTYFLTHLNQKQLSRALFPVGKYTKKEVRKLAKKFKLPNQNRKDSQGICFLGKVPFREFLKHHLGEKQGDFIDEKTGKAVGRHDGYWFYTIGQRYGLKLSGGPWFVVKKDVRKNVVYLAHGYQPKEVLKKEFDVRKLHWILGMPPEIPGQARDDIIGRLTVKIRHGAATHSCRLTIKEGGHGHITLKEPVHGVAPGQFAVFYKGDICLGCGAIA